ncbi:MAG: M3 family metallopeptidase [Planctomycetota bacterium]|jgi:Zn-dependent oligopeptidase
MTPTEFCDRLNHDYERIHTAKEDAFWTAYMGLAEDADAARADLDEKEKTLKAFLNDPKNLEAVRTQLETAEGDTREALQGWERTFAANVIDSAAGRELAAQLVDAEGALARARGSMKLGYTLDGEFHEANSIKLGTMLSADKDAARRKAAWEGLKAIEDFVLDNGFLEIVKMRNRLGRMMGAEDYYDWRVRCVEGLSKRQIFDLLDELEEKTSVRAEASLKELKAEKGDDAILPWNLRFATTGDITNEQDPYFPFAQSFERWGRSFAALGIEYSNAEMVLDLVDRKGKYENGFMHGPVPAWRDHGTFRPARIHFTANAIPGMVGSGRRATETFFHEGGHAAHFANIDMPSPCFAQEFAPTSVAFAEVQSMFLDSIIGDADWQTRYAQTASGEPMPFSLIEKAIRSGQPYAAHGLRGMFTVPYCEKAIYEIPDDELTAERVLDEVAAVERRMLGMERSARPALSIPHLLAGESSAYYHGYIMALVGVSQTRQYFLKRDGHLMDNPRIGPDLQRVYWKPGNSRTFFQFIEDLTGKPLSADDLAAAVNRTADEQVERAQRKLDKLPGIAPFEGEIKLGARIRVVHGNETVAACNGSGFADAADAFARWVETLATIPTS